MKRPDVRDYPWRQAEPAEWRDMADAAMEVFAALLALLIAAAALASILYVMAMAIEAGPG